MVCSVWVHYSGKTTPVQIWAATWQNQQSECAPSKDSDQPGRPPSLIRVFAVRMKKPWVLSYPLSTQGRLWSDWADAQADLGLRWAHTHFVGFVMSWLVLGQFTAIFSDVWILFYFFGLIYVLWLQFSHRSSTSSSMYLTSTHHRKPSLTILLYHWLKTFWRERMVGAPVLVIVVWTFYRHRQTLFNVEYLEL